MPFRCAQSPAATAALLAGAALDGAVAHAWFIARVIPLAIEHYAPVTVYDPTVGSGVMLVAAAQRFPAFANALGLVQYFGQDIDADAVLMAQINLKLNGLNGHVMPHAIRAAEAVLRQHGFGVDDGTPAVLPFPGSRDETQAAA